MRPEREPMENDSNSRTAEELEQQTVDVYSFSSCASGFAAKKCFTFSAPAASIGYWALMRPSSKRKITVQQVSSTSHWLWRIR